MRWILLLIACSGSPVQVNVIDATLSQSDVTIRVHYQDSDGNLGNGRAEIQDCRAAALVTKLPLPAIASDQAVKDGVTIEGELDLVVSGVTLVTPDAKPPCGTPTMNQTAFCVTLIDRGGNRSAASCTKSIALQ